MRRSLKGYKPPSRFRKTAVALGWAAVVLFSLILIGPGFIDWNRFKGPIERQASLAAGRAVSIPGNIGFSVLPRPVLSVSGLHVANVSGGVAPDLLSVARLEAHISLIALLSGEIQVTTFRLIDPVLSLEVMQGGLDNWTLDMTEASAPAIRLDNVIIRNAMISYRNAGSGIDVRLDKIDAQLTAHSLQGPFKMLGALSVHGVPLAFEGELGEIAPAAVVPLMLSARAMSDSGVEAMRLDFHGNVAERETNPKFNGVVRLHGVDMAQAAAAAGRMLSRTATLPAGLAKPFVFESNLLAASDFLQMRDARLEMEGGAISGAAKIAGKMAMDFDVELSSTSFDLNPLLGAAASFTLAEIEFDIPYTLSGAVRLNAGAVKAGSGMVRDVKLSLDVANGVASVRELSALFPGTSAVRIKGELRTDAGKPHFTGAGDANSENFRALLAWMTDLTGAARAGAELSALPEGRLTRMQADGQLDLTTEMLLINEIAMRADSTAVKGSIGVELRTRPLIIADLQVDKLNLDAYSTPQAVEPNISTAPVPAGSFSIASALTFLDGFDSRFKLSLKALTFRNAPVTGIKLAGELNGGTLVLNALSAADLAGAAVGIGGVLTNFVLSPQGEVNLRLASKDISGLARMLALPGAAAGALDLELKLLLAGDYIKATMGARADDTALNLAGAITGVTLGFAPSMLDTASLRATFEIGNQSFSKFASQMNIPAVAPADTGADAPLMMRGEFSGNLSKLLASVNIDVARGHIIMNGELANARSSRDYKLTIDASGEDLTSFLRGLGVGFRPASNELGGYDVRAALHGNVNGTVLSDMNAAFGPVSVRGMGELQLAGEKPELRAELVSGELMADLLLPEMLGDKGEIPYGAGRRGASAGQLPWSGEPIDLAVLDSFNVSVKFSSPHVVVRGIDLTEAGFLISVKNGAIALSEFNGKLFGGPLTLSAKLGRGGAGAEFSARFELTDADAAAASAALLGESAITGRFDFSGDINAAGASTFALVSALEGSGRLKAVNGVIRGIDLPAMNKQLDEVEEVADLLIMLRKAFAGGQTEYASLDAPFTISLGVLRSGETALDIDAASAGFNVTIDLPRYWLDSELKFALENHPSAPGFGVSFAGPVNNPGRSLHTETLEKYFTTKLVSSGLQRLLDASKTSPASPDPVMPDAGTVKPEPAPQTPQTDKPDTGASGWRGLLKGVIGDKKQ